MGARSGGRESALQMLFAKEASGATADKVIANYWRQTPGDPEGRAYADEAFRGVVENLSVLDKAIENASAHWRIERMARVDRNVLRLAAWELTQKSDVPGKVVLDEAVELAKRFGSETSGSFTNGILDRMAELLKRV